MLKGNEYTICGEYVLVKFSNSEKVFICDISDLEIVKTHTWYLSDRGYATTCIKTKKIKFHSLVMPRKDGMVVDHINRNKLDNRKSNLREVTQKENCYNKSLDKRNKSGHKGVFVRNGKYVAYIQHNKKFIHLGTYKNIEDAITARKEAEKIYFKIN